MHVCSSTSQCERTSPIHPSPNHTPCPCFPPATAYLSSPHSRHAWAPSLATQASSTPDSAVPECPSPIHLPAHQPSVSRSCMPGPTCIHAQHMAHWPIHTHCPPHTCSVHRSAAAWVAMARMPSTVTIRPQPGPTGTHHTCPHCSLRHQLARRLSRPVLGSSMLHRLQSCGTREACLRLHPPPQCISPCRTSSILPLLSWAQSTALLSLQPNQSP